MLTQSEQEERRINRLEHAKFLLYQVHTVHTVHTVHDTLLYQVHQELSLYGHNKDCVLQCQDGDLSTSLVTIAAVSALVRTTCQVRNGQ